MRQNAGPVRIQYKQAGVEQAAECMVMSGDLGSQVGAVCVCIHLSIWLPSCPFECVSICLSAYLCESTAVAHRSSDRF